MGILCACNKREAVAGDGVGAWRRGLPTSQPAWGLAVMQQAPIQGHAGVQVKEGTDGTAVVQGAPTASAP